LGIASASLALILVVLQMGLFFVPAVKKYIDFIGILSLIQMIVFIQYWMKINWYKQILQRDSEGNESEQL
jgi:amino acid transporter